MMPGSGPVTSPVPAVSPSTLATSLRRASPRDTDALHDFLQEVDLTAADLDVPDVRLWAAHDEAGRIVASTGYELSRDGRHALVRSVAVAPSVRGAGHGTALARFALDDASARGATRAWLFSRRSGPFWQRLGFERAVRDELVAVLPDSHQVRLFASTGQLHDEVAWSRALPA